MVAKEKEKLEEKTRKAPLSGEFNINPEEMLQAGLHFGHKTSKIHPKMMPYISGVKNTIHIIDTEKTTEKFKEALKFIQDLISQGGRILFVGTKIQTRELTKNTAIECGEYYVVNRWLGGTFTNFEAMKKRIGYFKELEKKKAEGGLEKYTKKERAKIDEELRDFEIKFGGTREMEKLPEAIFVLDIKKDALVVKESRQKGVKVIGITDTNCDPTLVDFPIPANDDAISSVKYILEKVKETILSVKLKVKSEK
jgi:small subunit ribosomal protein S2